MAHRIAAVAEVTEASIPKQMKNRKKWLDPSAQMRVGATELAKAAKANQPQDVIKAAAKINSACNSCHTMFRAGGGGGGNPAVNQPPGK